MRRLVHILLAGGLTALTGACTTYDPYAQPLPYDGSAWVSARQPWLGELTGPGVAILDPWLRETREGQAVVTLGFNEAIEGVISEPVAQRANAWFRRYADQNCDMRLTDAEIRTALVAAAGRYLQLAPPAQTG
jgi:hypothetical protein